MSKTNKQTVFVARCHYNTKNPYGTVNRTWFADFATEHAQFKLAI
jgi:hypothetical protein